MYAILKSSTAQPLVFFMISSTDHITGLTGATVTVTLSKSGGAFASPSGAVTEIGNGWYKVAGNATDSGTLGPLLLHATATGADPTDTAYAIVAYDPQDSVRAGLTALPNAAAGANTGLPVVGTQVPNATAGASSGLLINGSNSGTVTLAALTVTGATTHTGNVSMAAGLTITQSTTNAAGVSITGNGSGPGISSTGGAAVTTTAAGPGMLLTGGAASTSAGGVAQPALVCLGGAGAASTNGSASGFTSTGGGTTTVSGSTGATFTASGSATYGFTVTGTRGMLINGSNGLALGITGAGTGVGNNGITITCGAEAHGISVTGGNASGSTAAGDALHLVGGTASTSAGGVAGVGLNSLGGAGAASTNGAGAGGQFTGGGTTTVSGGAGLTLAHSGSASDFNATTTPLVLAKTTNITGFNDITAAAVATSVWEDTTAGGDFGTAGSIGKLIVTTGLTIAGVSGVTFPATVASPTNITAGTITTVTTVTNQLTAAAIATGVWQDTTAGDFTAAGSIGKSLAPSSLGTVPGASGGFLIAGSNAATTFVTLTSTGAFTVNGVSAVSQTGDSYARLGTPAGASVSADVAAVKSSVGSPMQAGSTVALTAGSFVTATFGTCDFTATMKASLNAATPASIQTVTNIVSGGAITTSGGKVSEVALVDTLTTYTGNTVQTGDSYARLGAPAGASVSADIAAAKSSIGSPMQAYTQPAGFLAATFPSGTLANTTNITAGTITTVTNVTNAPTSGDLTATMKSSISGLTIAHVTLVDTLTTYTGNTPQSGDSYPTVNSLVMTAGKLWVLNESGNPVASAAVLGTPAGASIAADLVEIEAETDGIAAIPTNPYTGTPPTVAQIATAVWEDTTAGGDFGTVGSIGKLIVTTGLTVASVTGAVGSISGVTFPTNFATLGITAGGHIANVDALTGNTPQTGDVYGLLTTAFTESYAADGATATLAQLLYMIYGAIMELSISGTTMTLKKLDHTTPWATVTLNDPTTPTARTRAT